VLSARMIDSAEALCTGLVNQVFPQNVFLDKVREYASDLAFNVSPRSMSVIMRQVYDAMFQTLAEVSRTFSKSALPLSPADR
jgi:enoyl-CoA hydratase/carnithine racemase